MTERIGEAGRRSRLTTGEAVETAAQWLFEGRRVDMQALAAELGITRMTLHRRVGSREHLIGEALWYLADRAWAGCIAEEDVRRQPTDADLRSVRVMQAYNAILVNSRGLRRLFDTEPDLSLRVLTDPEGSIEPRTVSLTVGLIDSDEAAGRLRPIIPPGDLAYALVKLAEAFLFGDLAAGRVVSADAANKVQAALLEAGRVEPR